MTVNTSRHHLSHIHERQRSSGALGGIWQWVARSKFILDQNNRDQKELMSPNEARNIVEGMFFTSSRVLQKLLKKNSECIEQSTLLQYCNTEILKDLVVFIREFRWDLAWDEEDGYPLPTMTIPLGDTGRTLSIYDDVTAESEPFDQLIFTILPKR